MQEVNGMRWTPRTNQKGFADFVKTLIAKAEMRRTIRALSALNDRELNDIGLRRADVQRMDGLPLP
jgi:uncharacterized protein YjiS (DUF1127 family)